MPATFNYAGVRFPYPENWQVEISPGEESWSAFVQSPSTAFLLVSFTEGEFDLGETADVALQELKSEYPKLEVIDAIDTISGLPAVGYDAQFFHFDLTNTTWIRAVPMTSGSLLLMAQFTDDESELNGEVLRGMLHVMQLDEPEVEE
ncbi:MAG: hypothetical protein R3B84_12255 [Zavarzinella sp.]